MLDVVRGVEEHPAGGAVQRGGVGKPVQGQQSGQRGADSSQGSGVLTAAKQRGADSCTRRETIAVGPT